MDYSHFCAAARPKRVGQEHEQLFVTACDAEFLTAMEDGVTFSLAAALWTNLEKQASSGGHFFSG